MSRDSGTGVSAKPTRRRSSRQRTAQAPGVARLETAKPLDHLATRVYVAFQAVEATELRTHE